MRRSKAVMIELLEKKERQLERSSEQWEARAMCCDNLEDCEQFLKWADQEHGEAMGYFFARALYTDDNYFAKNCELYEVGDM